MSERIRHTLLNHEETPPPEAWGKILTVLTEFDSVKTLREKLETAEITPAPKNWNSILSVLEENTIAGKLNTFEQKPPSGTWKKIAAGLDAAGPAIDKTKSIPWMRYAAAAVILVIISLGVMRLIAHPAADGLETARHEETTPVSVPTNQEISKEILEELVSQPPAENDEARNDAALEASKKTFAKLDYPAKKMAREVSGFYFATLNTDPDTRTIHTEVTPLTEGKEASRYITLMTPEGNIIRVSKKLGGMVCCISGEAEDPACADQLKKWREKILSSSLGHTADSFMDLLLLVNSTEENQPH